MRDDDMTEFHDLGKDDLRPRDLIQGLREGRYALANPTHMRQDRAPAAGDAVCVDDAMVERLSREVYEVHCNTPIGHFPDDSHFPKWRAVVQHVIAALAQDRASRGVEGMAEFVADLERSRGKYPNNARMFDGLMGEVDELRRAYGGDGDMRAEAFDVAVCAFRIATEGDAGGNVSLASQGAAAGVPEGWRLVPVEPTPEQVNAARQATLIAETFARGMWSAMLAAAPSAPTQGAEREVGP